MSATPAGLRCLVVSDLHAFAGPIDDAAPSQMAIHGDDNHAGRYFEECVVALEAEGIHDIDLVLCAGDITDRAEPECISAGQRVAPRPRSNS